MFISKRHIVVTAILLSASIAAAQAHDPKQQSMAGMQNSGQMGQMGSMSGMRMTGDQDYDFATMMRHHHEMAVMMANKEIRNGKNADMRRMAQTIADTQRKEIAQFDAWISAHKPTSTGHK